ncbi:MAG: hypothetical protein P8I38_00040 [Arenicella sp.]|nr:hypothetical protein [Arenicella sp.]
MRLKHRLAGVFMRLSAGMTGIDLRWERYENNVRWKLVEFVGLHRVTHYGDLIWQHQRVFHLALIATPQTNG